MSSDIHSRTVGGLMAYCDWLKDKGYQGAAATDSWKSATKMVFETVEPEGWETLSLDGIDLEDVIRRFQTLAGSKLRAETVTVYKRRIRLAMDAQAYYLEHSKPPSFKRGATRPKAEENSASGTPPKTRTKSASKSQADPPSGATASSNGGELVAFPFPISGNRMVRLHLPPSGLTQSDADRLSAFIRTLQIEEQRQIPRHAGEAQAA